MIILDITSLEKPIAVRALNSLREGLGISLYRNDLFILLAASGYGLYIINVENVSSAFVVSTIYAFEDGGKIFRIKIIKGTDYAIASLKGKNK